MTAVRLRSLLLFLMLQLAQLNQAAADARLLGGLLQQLAAQQAALQEELAGARREREWAEAEAKKRVSNPEPDDQSVITFSTGPKEIC